MAPDNVETLPVETEVNVALTEATIIGTELTVLTHLVGPQLKIQFLVPTIDVALATFHRNALIVIHQPFATDLQRILQMYLQLLHLPPGFQTSVPTATSHRTLLAWMILEPIKAVTTFMLAMVRDFLF